MIMNEADVLVIGAGACGLMAARELSKAGKKVIMLEARDRTGGRIHTLKDEGFSIPVEAGAEFIHGDLPLTQSLLKTAGISFYHREGEMYRVENGVAYRSEEFIKDFDQLLSKLKTLERDMPFEKFLHKHFGGDEYQQLRESATAFAEGYDTARIEKLSSLSLRDEWTSEGVSNPYLLQEGYGKLVSFIEEECKAHGCVIRLSSPVKKINRKKDHVEAVTDNDRSYTASRVLVTVPVSVLIPRSGNDSTIQFSPGLPGKYREALSRLGYGDVIKILLQFKNTFWEDSTFQEDVLQLPGLGFLLSKEVIPVWWTDLPRHKTLLTGWVGGPKAEALKSSTDEELLDKALGTLARLFKTNEDFLKEQLVTSYVANWSIDPFSQGAYSYTTPGSKEAIRILKEPVDGSIYFAGEALQVDNVGTVEAALVSGKEAAESMMRGRSVTY